VTIEGDLVLTANGTIEAVQGASITLTGSNVVNTSTDPAAMAGLSSMTLHFAGDGSVLDTFEVAGDPAGGFESNFALDAIHLGLSTRLQLVDRFANAPGAGEADEALFVGSLAISDAARLDLNGLDMLVGDQSPAQIRAWIDAGNILPGAMDRIEVSYDPVLECTIVHSAPVPEPTVLGLLTLGALAVTRRRSGSR
jgi:hypothetical protein